jgi:hypothetical protein
VFTFNWTQVHMKFRDRPQQLLCTLSPSVCWKTRRIPAEVGFWDPITDTLMHKCANTVEEIAIATRQRYAPELVIILFAALSTSSILSPGCNTHTCHSALLLHYPDSMPYHSVWSWIKITAKLQNLDLKSKVLKTLIRSVGSTWDALGLWGVRNCQGFLWHSNVFFIISVASAIAMSKI